MSTGYVVFVWMVTFDTLQRTTLAFILVTGKKCKLAHPRWEIPVEVKVKCYLNTGHCDIMFGLKDDEGQIISTSKLPPTKGGPEQDFSGPTR